MRYGVSLLLLCGSLVMAAAGWRVWTRLKGKLCLGLTTLCIVSCIALLVRSLAVLFDCVLPDWWNITVTVLFSSGAIVFWLRLEGHLRNGQE